LSPNSRAKRVAYYITRKVRPRGLGHWGRRVEYLPGTAGQALINGLGYRIDGKGRISPPRDNPNRIVISNGRSNHVNLRQFRLNCANIANQIYATILSDRNKARQMAA